MVRPNFYHAVFPLNSMLIPPAKYPTHPNYLQYLEYTEVQFLWKPTTNKSSTPCALSQVNRVFVSSLEVSMPFTSIGRLAHAQFLVASQLSSLKLPKRNSSFRLLRRQPGSGKATSHRSSTWPLPNTRTQIYKWNC